jgi:hypothetical protein
MLTRTIISLTLVVGVATVAACSASTARAAASASCDPRSQDSVFTVAAPAFRDCAVDTKVRLLTPDVRPDVSSSTAGATPIARGSNCYFVDLDFVVDTTGQVELGTAHVVRTSHQGFADALMATLPRLRYEPAIRGGAPVRQIVTEHRAISTMTVVVPAGQQPSRTSMPRPNRC